MENKRISKLPQKKSINQLINLKLQQGVSFHKAGRFEEAESLYKEILQLDPNHYDSVQLLGTIAAQLKQWDKALSLLNLAIKINNSDVGIFNNRGYVLRELKLLDQALIDYDYVIRVIPNYAEAHNNRGLVLKELGKLNEALSSFDKAIQLKKDYVHAHYNRAILLQELQRHQDALMSYSKVLVLNRDYDYLLGNYLHTKMFICDWFEFDSLYSMLVREINNYKKVSPTFPVLALTDSLLIQRKACDVWVRDKYSNKTSLDPILKVLRTKKSKIRIGYYSADFHNHATAYLMAELFELHDKNKFEIIGISFGPDSDEKTRERLCAAFDRFINVQHMSDKDIAALSRKLEIDIAIDLKGLTKGERLGIFSYRAAPIQSSYLGWPGTIGADYIDYLIADLTLIPAESQSHYSEKIIYLPNSYQVNDSKRMVSDRLFSREELGLPLNGFVFCCFNNNFKITPKVFDSWVRILKAVEGSVLWLLEDNPNAVINLRKEALDRGLDPKRVVFAQRMNVSEHLARHRAADLFIDTLPYNAHTTASDALWMGLPVLTCMGESFASRVAASLLKAIELEEMVAKNQEHYEAIAIELALNPNKLNYIRNKLIRNKYTAPLFNTSAFVKNIELAYLKIYERYQLGLKPDHIYI
jgi:predicted O-linked N-acetylglucosamine transferase (SPINDLY family)